MVRFSDLLGGSDDPEDARRATTSTPAVAPPEPEPESDPTLEPEVEPTETLLESPEDVLDRLTQYATSARAGDQVPDVREPAAVAPDLAPAPAPTKDEASGAFTTIGDDLLPRTGSGKKSGRGRKRRP